MLEGERLDAVCDSDSLTDLARRIHDNSTPDPPSSRLLQRRALTAWIAEIRDLVASLPAHQVPLIEWQLARVQVENAKLLLRAARQPPSPGRTPVPLLTDLAPIPSPTPADLESLAALEAFTTRATAGTLNHFLTVAFRAAQASDTPFLAEAAVDRSFLVEQWQRCQKVPAADKEWISPLVSQEIDAFHLQLVAQGRFTHHCPASELLELWIPGSPLTSILATRMLEAPDLPTALQAARGIALDQIPSHSHLDATVIDTLARDRYQRLAKRAFRGGSVGFGAIVGYLALRSIDVTNRITLAEGIRLGRHGTALRQHLIPSPKPEGSHA